MGKAWPKEIEIPDKIGIHRTCYADGSPCCAMGHFYSYRLDGEQYEAAAEAYLCAAEADGRFQPTWVVMVNDSSPPAKRRLYYLTAWALLGYTEGMPPEVLELRKKALPLWKERK